jgi:hypothetical protein
MVTEGDGELRDGRLVIQAQVNGPEGRNLQVNGVHAAEVSGVYTAAIVLDRYRNTVELADSAGGYAETVTVYWLKQAANKYRISVDDNIWFLQNIAENRHTYRSIFDNPFLAVYKELHDRFGTKVHFNIYDRCESFDLSQMPDTYKQEWQENADWMRLTFHALQNDPPKPYEFAEADEIMRDCKRVTEQIIRFAGEQLLEPATTIHYGAATREGCRALRQFGFRGMAGFFQLANGKPIVSYYLDNEQTEHLNGRDFWKDEREDLIFVKIDAVLDRLRLGDIVPHLQQVKARRGEAAFIELLIHEQYFYPHYRAYQPDYRDKLFAAAQWAQDNGYSPAFLSEVLLD